MDLRRLNLALLVLGLVLGVSLALLLQRDGDPPGETATQQRIREEVEVSRAAAAQVQAFLGVDHTRVEEQTQVVLDGATGNFKEQYSRELNSLIRSAKTQQSIAEATVLEVGIADYDDRTATVFVAADTQVSSKATRGTSRTVPWRIQLEMVNEGGRWLTAGLQFVG